MNQHPNADQSRLGSIAQLWRYPVKSMQGEQLDSVELDGHGIVGDRRYALRDLTSGTIISAKVPKLGRPLLTCRATTIDGNVAVTVGDVTYDIETDRQELDAALTSLLDRPVCVASVGADPEIYSSEWPELDGMALSGVTLELPLHDGTFADLASLHLMTTTSLEHLHNLEPDLEIAIQRFRPGIVIDHQRPDDEPASFVENEWAQLRARAGSAEIIFGEASPRCIMTTLEQPGLSADKRVLQTLGEHNRRDFAGFGNFACLGVYAETAIAGTASVGDSIDLLS